MRQGLAGGSGGLGLGTGCCGPRCSIITPGVRTGWRPRVLTLAVYEGQE